MEVNWICVICLSRFQIRISKSFFSRLTFRYHSLLSKLKSHRQSWNVTSMIIVVFFPLMLNAVVWTWDVIGESDLEQDWVNKFSQVLRCLNRCTVYKKCRSFSWNRCPDILVFEQHLRISRGHLLHSQVQVALIYVVGTTTHKSVAIFAADQHSAVSIVEQGGLYNLKHLRNVCMISFNGYVIYTTIGDVSPKSVLKIWRISSRAVPIRQRSSC